MIGVCNRDRKYLLRDANWICVCMYVCMYVFIYIYMYMHMYVYIYIYMLNSKTKNENIAWGKIYFVFRLGRLFETFLVQRNVYRSSLEMPAEELVCCCVKCSVFLILTKNLSIQAN